MNKLDQNQINNLFSTAFDKYDRNHDGIIDYNEFQSLIIEMYQIITRQYGGPALTKIRQAWSEIDYDGNGYITKQEFNKNAKIEIESILSQPSNGTKNVLSDPVSGQYGTGYGQQSYQGYGRAQYY